LPNINVLPQLLGADRRLRQGEEEIECWAEDDAGMDAKIRYGTVSD